MRPLTVDVLWALGLTLEALPTFATTPDDTTRGRSLSQPRAAPSGSRGPGDAAQIAQKLTPVLPRTFHLVSGPVPFLRFFKSAEERRKLGIMDRPAAPQGALGLAAGGRSESMAVVCSGECPCHRHRVLLHLVAICPMSNARCTSPQFRPRFAKQWPNSGECCRLRVSGMCPNLAKLRIGPNSSKFVRIR